MTFPMSVGATTVLYNGAPDAGRRVRNSRSLQADRLLRRADALCRDGRAARSRHAAISRRRCAAAFPPARRCRRRSARNGGGSPASTFSTASARPRCCTSSSPIAPATSSTEPRASRCPATTCASSTSMTHEVGEGEIGELLVRGASAASGLLEPPRARAARPSAATGPTPATNTRSCRAGGYRLLRPHRRHVQGQRHLGLAVRGRAGAGRPSRGAGGGGRAQARRRRPGEAEGVRGAEVRRQRRRISTPS